MIILIVTDSTETITVSITKLTKTIPIKTIESHRIVMFQIWEIHFP